MTIQEQVRQLKLPTGQYVVFGSALLEVYGLRDRGDIDIVVTPELFDQLMDRPGWDLEISAYGTRILRHHDEAVEVFDKWLFGSYRPDTGRLIAEAEVIDGVSFVRLEEVLAWKRDSSREKDQHDTILLQTHLLQHAY